MLDLGDSVRAMSPRLRSSLSTPLVCGSRLVGVLSLYSSTKDAFSDEHQRVLEVVASQVSSTFAEILSGETQRTGVLRDSSTGLPNMAHLAQLLKSQPSVLDPERPLSMIVVSLGFQPGDANDAEFGSMLAIVRKAVRSGDLLLGLGQFRLGIVLLHTERHTAELLCKRVASTLVASAPGANASVGLCCALGRIESIDDLLVTIARAPWHGGGPEAIH
jgi:hypothetical protein